MLPIFVDHVSIETRKVQQIATFDGSAAVLVLLLILVKS